MGSTIKPDEGMGTPEVWRGVVQLFEEAKRSNPPIVGNGYWRLTSEQVIRFSSITNSSSAACIAAWQEAYNQLTSREMRQILRLPKEQRHLRVVNDQDDK